MKSWTFARIIILSLFLGACSRNPLGEDIQQPILNLAIILSQSCNNSLNQDAPYSCQINTSEPNPTIVYSLGAASTCTWATIDPSSGLISGTPNDDQVGNCNLIVDATSGKATASPLAFAVDVANLAPTLTIANAASLNEDDPLTLIRDDLSVQANEEGFGVYSFDLATTTAPICNASALMLTINPASGAISFAPALNYSGTCNIKVAFDDGNGAANSVVTSEFAITVIPTNDPPVISPIANVNTNEDVPYVLNFTVTDNDDVLTCATAMSATSSDLALIPNANIVFTGTSPNCTATITPLPNQYGTSTITLTATDGALSDTEAFVITVNSVNDVPVISPIANLTTAENTPVVANFTITDVDNVLACTALNLTATSSSIVVIPVPNIVFGGTAPNCTATITPAPSLSGVSNISITVNDNGVPDLQATQTFSVTVTPYDDPPVLSPIGNQLTPEDVPLVINFTITDIDSTLVCATAMSAVSVNTTLLPNAAIVFGGTAPNCTATLTPNPDAFGASNVTFSLTDGVSIVTESINFTVNAVNDNPNIPNINDRTMTQDTTDVINFTITDVDSALDCTTAVSANSSNLGLLPVANIVFGGVAPNCTATVTPLALQNGLTNLDFTVTDGFLTNVESFALTVSAVNYPPVISAIGNQTINEDGNIVVNFTITDLNDTLDCTTAVSATSSDLGLLPVANIIFAGGAPNCTATITPLADQNGSSNLGFTVTDGFLTDVENFTLTVNAVNDAPVLSAIVNQTTGEDTALVINFTIDDVDSTLNCTTSMAETSSNLVLLPVANVVFAGTAPNCTATLTPLADQTGFSNLSFTVTDGTLSDVENFVFTVNATNDAPVLSAIGNQTTNEDTPVVINFTATDTDSVLSCSGTHLSITSTDTALIPVANVVYGGAAPNCTATITPVANLSGVSNFVLTLNDNETPSLSDTQSFSVTVVPIQDAPTLSAIANQTINEDGSIVLNFTIDDVDSTLDCTTSMSATSSSLTLLPIANIVFAGTAPNCTATVTPLADQNGSSNLSFTVSDGALTDVENFTFTVNPVNDAPVLSAIANQTTPQDTPLVLNFTINDVDSALNCGTAVVATSTNTTLLPVANIVFGGTAPNCTATLSPALLENGVTDISFTLSDGFLSDVENFTFTVNYVNYPPVLSAITNQTIDEDDNIVLNFTITDLNDTLNCATSMSATSSAVSLLPIANIVFAGAAPNCTATITPLADQNGLSNLSFTVSDGSLSDVENFSLTVNPINDAPILSAITNQTTPEDTALVINFTVTDVDSTLNCSTSISATSSDIALVPVANIAFAGTAPNCTATVTPVANQTGFSNLGFTLTDGSLTDVENFSFTVNAANDPPILSAIGAQSYSEDAAHVINFTITDLDSVLDCTTSMSATSSDVALLPVANIVFGGTAPNCTATLNPLPDQNGFSNLSFTVTDGALTDVENFVFTVNAVNDAPVLSAIGNQTTNEDTAVVVNFTITDIDSVLVCSSANLSITSSDAGIIPVANVVYGGTAPNCTATITPLANQNGLVNFTLTLSDNGTPNLQDSSAFSVTVDPVNDAPVISAIAAQTNSEDTAHVINFTITDLDSVLNCTTSMSATSSDVALLPVANIVFGGTAPNCTATLNPLADQNGFSNLGFTVTDGALTDVENFTYTVNPVNDAPILSAIANLNTNEDTPAVVNFTITDIDSVLVCTSANLAITSSAVGIVPVANVVYGGTAPNCTATITPLLNQNGLVNFILTLSDNGTPNLQDTSAFSLTVDPINDAPTQSTIANQSTLEDTPIVINFTIADVDDVLACGTALTANTSDTILLPVANIVFGGTAPNCTATVSSALNLSGLVNITIRVSDTVDFNDQTFSLTVTPVNDNPVVSVIANQTTPEDTPLVVNFTITDVDSALDCTTSMSATSSDILLLPGTNIVFAGTAPNCSATLSPATNRNGLSNIVFTATDPSAATGTSAFSFTVTAVNDAPVLSTIIDQTTSEDLAFVINFTITDSDSTLNCATSMSATSSNIVLLPVASVVFGGTAPNCTATVTPAANQSGTSNLSFTVTDGTLTDVENFVLTVTPFDDPPTISVINDILVNEDAAPIVVNFTINDVDSTLNCATSMSRVSSNAALIPVGNIVFGGTAPNCTATLTLVANANGTTNITFTVTDGNSNVDEAFTVDVNPINDAPSIAAIGGQSTPEDTPIVVNFTVTDVDHVLNCATQMSATSTNNTVVPNATAFLFGGTFPNCTLTITPGVDRTGSSNITIFASDGSLTGQRTFTLTVTAVNDAPVMSNILDQSTNEDVVSSGIPFTISDAETAVTCASVTRGSSNIALIPVANIVITGTAPNCVATITPVANGNGVSNITLTVTDAGALTASRTFAFTVNPINDPPTISAITNRTTTTALAVAVTFTIADIDTAVTCTSTYMSLTSTNTTLMPTANVVWSGTAPNCTGTITPAAAQTGTSNLEFVINDGTTSVASAFLLTVNPNTAPTMDSIANQTIYEGRPQTINFVVDDINETLTCTGTHLSATSSNGTLLPVGNIAFSGTYPNCVATLNSANGQSGTSNVVITVTDSGALTDTSPFTVTGHNITSVALSPLSPIVPKTSNFSFTLTATYSDASSRNITTSSTWATSNVANSSFPSPGVLNNTYGGTATITTTVTATYGAFSANTVATINPATITSIFVDPTSANINIGNTLQVKCYGRTSDNGVIDLTGSCSWATANATIVTVNNTLDKGLVTGVNLGSATNITATYSSFSAIAAITVDNNTPAQSDNGIGLLGRYFSGGAPYLQTQVNSRIDSVVNFNWINGSNPAGNAEMFSVRWTGFVKAPTTGTYTFFTTSDDGVRLWVNGTQIINNWTNHAAIENSGTIALTAGVKYSITLEFYENSGQSQIELRYQGPSVGKQIIPQSQLYPP